MPTPTLQEMMGIMTGILQMMADDKKKNAHWMASAKLDEKYFRSITKFDNTKSGWKEWRRHFLNAVRECDDSFADLIEGYEKHDGPLDSLHAYNPTQGSSQRTCTTASSAVPPGPPSRSWKASQITTVVKRGVC